MQIKSIGMAKLAAARRLAMRKRRPTRRNPVRYNPLARDATSRSRTIQVLQPLQARGTVTHQERWPPSDVAVE